MNIGETFVRVVFHLLSAAGLGCLAVGSMFTHDIPSWLFIAPMIGVIFNSTAAHRAIYILAYFCSSSVFFISPVGEIEVSFLVIAFLVSASIAMFYLGITTTSFLLIIVDIIPGPASLAAIFFPNLGYGSIGLFLFFTFILERGFRSEIRILLLFLVTSVSIFLHTFSPLKTENENFDLLVSEIAVETNINVLAGSLVFHSWNLLDEQESLLLKANIQDSFFYWWKRNLRIWNFQKTNQEENGSSGIEHLLVHSGDTRSLAIFLNLAVNGSSRAEAISHIIGLKMYSLQLHAVNFEVLKWNLAVLS